MVARDNNMGESNSEQESTSSITLTHEEILEFIEEIKEFEKKFQEHGLKESEGEVEFIEIEKDIVEFAEVEQDSSEQIEFIPVVGETKKPELKKSLKNSQISKPRYEVQKEKIEEKAIDHATFKIRFNEEGELVNIDLKKHKPKPESKKSFDLKKLKKLRIKRKGKTEKTGAETETIEKKSKISKLKGGLSQIGKLKRVIPYRGIKSEKTEEPEAEE